MANPKSKDGGGRTRKLSTTISETKKQLDENGIHSSFIRYFIRLYKFSYNKCIAKHWKISYGVKTHVFTKPVTVMVMVFLQATVV